jgi:polyferredoxin
MEAVWQGKSDSGAARRLVQWLLAPVVVVTIALGWKYPLLGFTVPAAMVTGMVGGLLRGRYVCGHLCPRGAFFDRLLAPLTPRREIPGFFRGMGLRWGVFALLIGFMAWRLAAGPQTLAHWGMVFWSVCAITTAVAVVFALTIHPRTWCAFCPMGTLQNALGGGKYALAIEAGCRECRLCEKSCTMRLPIAAHRASGTVSERDCVQCCRCVEVCPQGALRWPEAQSPAKNENLA